MNTPTNAHGAREIMDEDIDTTEIEELTAVFFHDAISTQPGENLNETVKASRSLPQTSLKPSGTPK